MAVAVAVAVAVALTTPRMTTATATATTTATRHQDQDQVTDPTGSSEARAEARAVWTAAVVRVAFAEKRRTQRHNTHEPVPSRVAVDQIDAAAIWARSRSRDDGGGARAVTWPRVFRYRYVVHL